MVSGKEVIHMKKSSFVKLLGLLAVPMLLASCGTQPVHPIEVKRAVEAGKESNSLLPKDVTWDSNASAGGFQVNFEKGYNFVNETYFTRSTFTLKWAGYIGKKVFMSNSYPTEQNKGSEILTDQWYSRQGTYYFWTEWNAWFNSGHSVYKVVIDETAVNFDLFNNQTSQKFFSNTFSFENGETAWDKGWVSGTSNVPSYGYNTSYNIADQTKYPNSGENSDTIKNNALFVNFDVKVTFGDDYLDFFKIYKNGKLLDNVYSGMVLSEDGIYCFQASDYADPRTLDKYPNISLGNVSGGGTFSPVYALIISKTNYKPVIFDNGIENGTTTSQDISFLVKPIKNDIWTNFEQNYYYNQNTGKIKISEPGTYIINTGNFGGGAVKITKVESSKPLTFFYSKSSVSTPEEIFANTTKSISVNVNAPLTLDQIKAQFTAKDFNQQAVTNIVWTAKGDEYPADKTKVIVNKNYEYTVTATDSYGQTSSIDVVITPTDTTAPVVTVNGTPSIAYSKKQVTLDDLKTYVAVTDNGTSFGGSVSSAFTIGGDVVDATHPYALTGDMVAAGLNVTVTATDQSGNKTSKDFQIKVTNTDVNLELGWKADAGNKDDTTLEIGVSKAVNLTQEQFLAKFTATDSVDGDISSKIALKGSPKWEISKVGQHSFTLSVTDSAGIVKEKNVVIDTVVDSAPSFNLDEDNYFFLSSDFKMSEDEIKNYIVNTAYSGKVVSTNADDGWEFDASAYVGNEATAGDYLVTASVPWKNSAADKSWTIDQYRIVFKVL